MDRRDATIIGAVMMPSAVGTSSASSFALFPACLAMKASRREEMREESSEEEER